MAVAQQLWLLGLAGWNSHGILTTVSGSCMMPLVLWLCGEVLWSVLCGSGREFCICWAVPGAGSSTSFLLWFGIAQAALWLSGAPVGAGQEALPSEQEEETAVDCLTFQCRPSCTAWACAVYSRVFR